MEQQSIIVNLGKKSFTLRFQGFDSEIDLDDLTKIHYENIYGELVTISALLNRVGLLKSEADNELAELKLTNEIHDANLRKTFKSQKIAAQEKYNLQDIDDAVITDPTYKNNQLKLNRLQKQVNDINSIYWAVKSKDDKLTNLRSSFTPEDFEANIFDSVINGFMISATKNLVGNSGSSERFKKLQEAKANTPEVVNEKVISKSEEKVIEKAKEVAGSVKGGEIPVNTDFEAERKETSAEEQQRLRFQKLKERLKTSSNTK